MDEAYRAVTVRDGERNVTVPMAQAGVRAIAVNAAKGRQLVAEEADELREVIAHVKPKDWKDGHANTLAETEKAIEVVDMMLQHGG